VEIIGHKKQQEFLKKMVESENVPHALLFTGNEKLGKKKIAFNLISSIFKENIFQHPDFNLVIPKEKQIQINQIRDVNWKLSLKPVKAPLLSIIIDHAHLMTKQAQNCFLKTLEEPKSRALLVLISEYPRHLLPTIISRCQIVKFYPVEKKEINNYLKTQKFKQEQIDEISQICLGRPGVAIDFSQNLKKLEERQKKVKELVEIVKLPLSLRFKYAKELSERNDDLKETLFVWLSHFRRNLISCPDNSLISKTKRILNHIQRTIFLLSTTNVNKRLALEVLMLEL
jgi:DNA polymerase-3 subunit delta'